MLKCHFAVSSTLRFPKAMQSLTERASCSLLLLQERTTAVQLADSRPLSSSGNAVLQTPDVLHPPDRNSADHASNSSSLSTPGGHLDTVDSR